MSDNEFPIDPYHPLYPLQWGPASRARETGPWDVAGYNLTTSDAKATYRYTDATEDTVVSDATNTRHVRSGVMHADENVKVYCVEDNDGKVLTSRFYTFARDAYGLRRFDVRSAYEVKKSLDHLPVAQSRPSSRRQPARRVYSDVPYSAQPPRQVMMGTPVSAAGARGPHNRDNRHHHRSSGSARQQGYDRSRGT